jgi:Bacterial regulatory proteins, lacI family
MSQTEKTKKFLPRPTMTDVAKLAGVSQSTVSMVLNNVTALDCPQKHVEQF